MGAIQDDIDELEREIDRLKRSHLKATPDEILSVCRRTLQLVRRVAERQEGQPS